jgi:GNAT superfamily N-acetyltransferase
MQERNCTIKTMTRKEVDIAIGWAAAEGWNPGLYDADCFYTADSGGFLMGLVGDEPVASISAVKYGGSFGFIGFYIVKPEHRGKGYGMQIWEAAMASLQSRTIGLDGVIAQQENYKKSGFVLAYRNIRHQGTGGGQPPGGLDIVPLSTLSFDGIGSYDQPFFPDRSEAFLKCWINQPRSVALGLRHHGKLAGYGILRVCRSGYKIGPLFADSPAGAEGLFLALRAHAAEGAPIYLDTPEVNAAALDLAKRHNMSVAFETARMYRGKSPELPLDRLFGVTSFELG